MLAPGHAQTRRNFLRATVAGASIAAAPQVLSSGPAAAALPTVKPLQSHQVFSSFGVCALPNHKSSAYRYTAQWMAALESVGASYFRGLYSSGIDSTQVAIREARQRNIDWGMLIATDLDCTDGTIRERIRHIAANASDICRFVEGLNEPNWVRSTSRVPSNWVYRTVAKQKVIYEAVRSQPRLNGVPVLGPSLRDVSSDESDYKALANAGILRYMDQAPIHRYPGGRYADHLMNERMAMIRRAWPNKPIWITETGYTNALNTTGGHNPVPEDVAAIYAPSSLLEAVDRNAKVSWYELLDDPDSNKDDIESNFGMFAIRDGLAAPWRPKPVAIAMREFLGELRDPGPSFDTGRVALRISSSASDVRDTVTAKRNGARTVHLRRSKPCWDHKYRRRLYVPKVSVRIETASGARTVQVGSEVLSVRL